MKCGWPKCKEEGEPEFLIEHQLALHGTVRGPALQRRATWQMMCADADCIFTAAMVAERLGFSESRARDILWDLVNSEYISTEGGRPQGFRWIS